MKSLTLFLLLICSIFQCFAQDNHVLNEELIVLKNGNHISGELVDTRKNFITIYQNDKRVVIRKKRIESIFFKGDTVKFARVGSAKLESNRATILGENIEEGLTINDAKYKLVSESSSLIDKRGWYNMTYAAVAFPSFTNGGDYYPSFENVTGYQFSQYAGVGLGVGFLPNRFRISKIIPVYGEYRGYINQGKVSFYYNVAVGFTYGVKDRSLDFTSFKPRQYFHPSIGYKIGSAKSSFMIDIGLRNTNILYRFEDRPVFMGSIDELHSQRELVVRIGIML